MLKSLDVHGELIVRRVKVFDRRRRVYQKEQNIKLIKKRFHMRAMRIGFLKSADLLSRHQRVPVQHQSKSHVHAHQDRCMKYEKLSLHEQGGMPTVLITVMKTRYLHFEDATRIGQTNLHCDRINLLRRILILVLPFCRVLK